MNWDYNKIRFLKNPLKNNSETVKDENGMEIPREILKGRYMFPEERQKIIDNLRSIIIVWYRISKNNNFLDNTPNQSTKYRTKNWIEINDASKGANNTNSQIKFKTSMLRLILCDYSNTYILPSGTIRITGEEVDDAAEQLDERNKRMLYKNPVALTVAASVTDTGIYKRMFGSGTRPLDLASRKALIISNE